MKKICIVGIGGIGGFLGAKLSLFAQENPDLEIHFVQRGEHLNKIKQDGLTYLTKNKYVIHPTSCTDDPSSLGEMDLIIFCVKSKDLIPSARSMAPCMSKDTILLSILNGVDNDKRLKILYPKQRILNGCIYVSAGIKEPGVVAQIGGAGHLCFGSETEAIIQFTWIHDLFTHAGIKSKLTSAIQDEIWRKYLFVETLATITTAHGIPVGAIVENDGFKTEWEELLQEVLLLAKCKNIVLTEKDMKSAIARVSLLPYETQTSMQADAEKGKEPELDIFTQYVVNEARNANALVPLHTQFLKQLQH